ncbi:hypothetical protein D3C78_1733550 [compost metagenome]
MARSSEGAVHCLEDDFVRQLRSGEASHVGLRQVHTQLIVFDVRTFNLNRGFKILVGDFVAAPRKVFYMLGADPAAHFGKTIEPCIKVAARNGRDLHGDLVPSCGSG